MRPQGVLGARPGLPRPGPPAPHQRHDGDRPRTHRGVPDGAGGRG